MGILLAMWVVAFQRCSVCSVGSVCDAPSRVPCWGWVFIPASGFCRTLHASGPWLP